MQKFLKHIALFTLILPGFLLVFTVLWGLLVPGFITDNLNYQLGSNSFFYNRMREADQSEPVDVLVLGASQAYRGFDPRIFNAQGISLFNLGSSNQTQVQTEAIVNNYMSKLKPSTIFFVVNPESFSMDGIESSIDFLCNGIITKQTVSMIFKVNALKTYFTFIYAGFRQLFRLDKNFNHPSQIDENKYIAGGYVENNANTYLPKNHQDSIFWHPRKFQQQAFQRTLKKLKNSGSNIILIQAPMEPSFCEKIDNFDWYNRYLNAQGLPYLDYTKLIPLPQDMFYDEFHLNQKGVIVFNTDIIQRLQLNKK
jgi:lysophospholipase L1-like esterase